MMWKRKGWTLAELMLAWMLGLGAVAALGAKAEGLGAFAGQGAAIATTTVSDTVYKADGTAATGTVLISWPGFTAATGANVPAGSAAATIGANGLLTVPLVPNAGSTPMGSYYTAVYHLDDGSVTREYWVVPVSVGAVKVSAIRSTVLPTSVAMQTVSKGYVDTAIAAAVTGHPLDASTPYVLKTGDTMSGPLVLPADPVAPLQASDKQYVDTQVAAVASGVAQKVSTLPQGTQTVAQPPGTQLQVNNLNGVLQASQYVSGAGNNGIANATASADCASGCQVTAEQTYSSTERGAPTTWNNQTHVEDRRGGSLNETFFNTMNQRDPGGNAGEVLDMVSTQAAADVHAATGSTAIGAPTVVIYNEALAGGTNTFPQLLQGTVPYSKSTYSALSLNGTNNTVGQHILLPQAQNCYGVGDCLMGSMFLTSSGGFRDDADEGAHPFDLLISEDQRVFQGNCASGCTTGAMVLQVNTTAAPGTQGEGRYLMDLNTSKVLTGGTLTGGVHTGVRNSTATFAGTNFAVSTFVETAQTIPTQANQIAPGTVTVPIVTSGVPAGFAANTAALPATAGVACVADPMVGDARPLNFETAAYRVVDGSHLQLTLNRAHAAGATVAVGGLCGYGLEQKADTLNGIRQVYPVIGSVSPTSLIYAGGTTTSLIGVVGLQSAYANVSLVVAQIARQNNVVTVTTAGDLQQDVNGLQMTLQGVTDTSYNGTFTVTTTGQNTLTFASNGPNSTSAGGTLTFVTGGYALYPMAEVLSVYNTTTKAVDGQMTLAANTVNWASGDPLEEPHYFQEAVAADVEGITQFEPRPSSIQSAGLDYEGNTGPGLIGFQVTNGVAASQYFGNGGTHTAPSSGLDVLGIWRHTMDVQAGEDAVIGVQCNSHGCDKWNSGYDLFQMSTSVGVDRQNYSPATSTLSFQLRGTAYQFNPTGFTAGTINVGTLNAGTIRGSIAAASLPVFGASGSNHAAGAVPDPGATAGSTRFLREDGTWVAVGTSTVNGPTTTTSTAAAQMLSLLPERTNLLGEHLLTEGTGTVAHDTSGLGNDAPITGATWEGTVDLNFASTGAFYQLPTAENQTNTWMFALYNAPLGNAKAPMPPGYGQISSFGANPSVLCGTNQTLTCFISTSMFGPKSHRFLAFNTDGTESAEALTAGVHIVTIVCGDGGANATHYFYDGQEVGSYVAQGNSTCSHATTGNYQIGGSTAFGGTWFTGKMAGDWEWSTRLSAGEVSAATKMVSEYIRSKGFGAYARPVVRTAPVVIAGLDSRTAGAGNPAGADWLSLTQITDSTFTKLNLAISGSQAFDHCAMFDSMYAPYISQYGGQVIVSLWGDVNDVGSARQRADSLKCLVKKSKAAGARVILATEISNSQAETVSKDGVDAILRAEAYMWGVDNLVDLATNATLGADNAYTHTSCFPDGLHPGPNCEPLIAAMESNAINELIGSTEGNRHTTAAASYAEVAGDRFLDLNGTGAQTVTLPDCTGYTLKREVVNLGTIAATIGAVGGQTLTGSGTLQGGSRAMFVPIPGALATAGCRWERTE